MWRLMISLAVVCVQYTTQSISFRGRHRVDDAKGPVAKQVLRHRESQMRSLVHLFYVSHAMVVDSLNLPNGGNT